MDWIPAPAAFEIYLFTLLKGTDTKELLLNAFIIKQ